MVKTKIIGTLGPASSTGAVLRKLMRAGIDVVRLNCSHGTPAEHRARIRIVRALNRACRRHIRILLDLEGYRIRVGALPGSRPLPLKKDQLILLSRTPRACVHTVVPFDYEGALADIPAGADIFIDDGTIALRVVSRSRSSVKARVVVPGILKERKGINIPQAALRFRGLKPKDARDIAFGLSEGVDFIAQSFVRSASDMRVVRDALRPARAQPRLIAKIENRQGIERVDEILRESDGIMIARGDLGVSLPIYEIPLQQKLLIRAAKGAGKIAITATQMLESMTEQLRPTRAEATDVANAVLDGSDYLMLSAETAVGKHPVEAVATMNRIIAFTEKAVSGGLLGGGR